MVGVWYWLDDRCLISCGKDVCECVCVCVCSERVCVRVCERVCVWCVVLWWWCVLLVVTNGYRLVTVTELHFRKLAFIDRGLRLFKKEIADRFSTNMNRPGL